MENDKNIKLFYFKAIAHIYANKKQFIKLLFWVTCHGIYHPHLTKLNPTSMLLL